VKDFITKSAEAAGMSEAACVYGPMTTHPYIAATVHGLPLHVSVVVELLAAR
jgi:hypothetical protein